MSKFTVEPVKEHIGRRIHVDKAHLCNDDVVAACRKALHEGGVVVFPKIDLSDAEQVAFTDKFGARLAFTGKVPGGESQNDTYKITLDKKVNNEPDYIHGTWFWHMDGMTVDMPLPIVTFLSARKISQSGGQTQFCSTSAGYQALPEFEKKALEGLKVVHRTEANMRLVYGDLPQERIDRYRAISGSIVHPLVRTDSEGRTELVTSTTADFVLDMPRPEGRALMARLIEWCAQPDFFYSHEWQEGDFVLWDNRCIMHRVVPYPEESGRMMHRTTVYGEEVPGEVYRELEAA